MLFIRVKDCIAWVLIIQVLEKTLYLESYGFLDIIELRNLSVLEVTQEAAASEGCEQLASAPLLVGELKDVLEEVAEEFILLKGSFEVLEVCFFIFLFMVGILTLREFSSKEELPDIIDTTRLEILICLTVENRETAES